MASPRRNLPAFTEIAERVALLESIRSSPSAVPAHYANILEDIAVVLRKWSGLAPAIAANPEAAALVGLGSPGFPGSGYTERIYYV